MPTTMNALDPRRLDATMVQLAREHLSVFVACAFRVLRGEAFLRNWHMDAICHELMRVASGETTRLIITMPPRTMKSFIGSVCLPAWLLGKNPAEKIICASYGQDLSNDFARDMRSLMQSALYRRVFPTSHLDPRGLALDHIRTTRGGYRMSTSTGGTLTGRGATFIIIDDPTKAQDAHSEAERDRAWTWYSGAVVTRLNNPKTGRIVVIAQRLHMNDLAGRLIAAGGWKELCLPLEADRDQEIVVSPNCSVNRPAGNILHQDRFGEAEVARLRSEMGERDFEAQYNQRPMAPGGALFKLSWLRRYDERPKPQQIQGIFQSWDTAYEIAGDNDYSVCTTWALSGKHCYLLDVFRDRLPFHALEKKVYELQNKHKADLVIVEKAGSGISLIQNIRDLAKKRWLDYISPVGSKQDRASQQTPKFERGEIWVPRDASWLKAFEDELASFPQGKHDDQVDSVVQFLAAVDTGRLLIRADHAKKF